LSALTALYLVVFTNQTFWGKINLYLAAYPLAVATLYLAISCLFFGLVTMFSVKYLTKPFFIVLVVVAGVSSWFTDRFGVVIDSDMVRNAFETTPAEAGHLLTPAFAWHLALYVLLPVVAIIWVRIVHHPFGHKLMRNSVAITVSFLVFGIAGFSHSKTFVTAIRQHKDLVKTLNPITPLSGTMKYLMQTGAEQEIVVAPLGTDATVRPAIDGIRKPRVTVIVAGETARAANFALGGYGRDTNPELARRDIVYFAHTTSCGTATATSIPCMFSNLTRSSYSHRKSLENENLVDVLSHAGIQVEWWDNNTGSKGVADRIRYVDLATSTDPRFCRLGECQDAIFFDKLDAWLDNVDKDSVLVLHQLGSHGPTYYLRYPEDYRRFTPDCRTAELGDCLDSEILNAYDNTILYTDHVLSVIIDKLAAHSQKLAGAMLYMSDHGESLGENGLYLHGTPYLFAPDTQTHVPFLTWMDPDFAASFGVDRACLTQRARADAYSHDNLFHSVLGMMNVSTSVYDPQLDVFAACKRTEASSATRPIEKRST